MNIPFVDLRAQYTTIKQEVDDAIARVIADTAFIGGHFVEEFETAFARDYGAKHCISVANGTDAIYVTLRMLGIGAGDEVITSAHSWISTSETISQTGARPIFIDVDDYFTLDADLIEASITPRTRAIVPVHLYGQSADMTKIMALARQHNLFVVEDCAQAHYSRWQDQRVGSFGHAATFSFYPGKNLGAYGDAGAILTNDDDLARRMRMYANHGALRKHHHVMEGINSRMDGMQAAILNAKLPHIHEWTAARRQVAAWYDEMLADVQGVTTPKIRGGAVHTYHLYVVKLDRRDAVMARLAKDGIQTAIHYPVALPAMEAYRYLNPDLRRTPRAVQNSARILSLPIYPEQHREMIEYVVGALARALRP